MLYGVGDVDPDFFAIEAGAVDIVREPIGAEPARVVARFGPGGLLGELSILSHQDIYVTARVTEAGRVRRVPAREFRRLMASEGEISDLLLIAFQARRDMLLTTASDTIEIVGRDGTAASLALRTYLQRMRLPHRWIEVGTREADRLLLTCGADASALPVALLYGSTVLLRATPGDVAVSSGLAYRPRIDEDFDLVVVGRRTAGLAAAVYGASEGLETLCVDAIGPGGQAAAASSRIENYLGFPSGLSGTDLATRAAIQALKFGARLNAPCEIVALRRDAAGLMLDLADGTAIRTRAVILATGARYRRLGVDRWAEFEGAGIYFAATEFKGGEWEGPGRGGGRRELRRAGRILPGAAGQRVVWSCEGTNWAGMSRTWSIGIGSIRR